MTSLRLLSILIVAFIITFAYALPIQPQPLPPGIDGERATLGVRISPQPVPPVDRRSNDILTPQLKRTPTPLSLESSHLITSIGFPKLDASAKDARKLKTRVSPQPIPPDE